VRQTCETRKCVAQSKRMDFLFYRLTDANALEFGHILASSCKTFRAFYFHVSCVLGRVLPLLCDDCRPSLVGGSFEVHDPPASPTPSGRGPTYNTKLCLDYCICKRPVLLEMCIVFPRARRACNKNTPVQHTITQSANCRDQCSVTAEKRDHTPPCRSPLRLSLCRRLGLLQDQLAPCSCTPPATLLCAPLEIPLLDRPQPIPSQPSEEILRR